MIIVPPDNRRNIVLPEDLPDALIAEIRINDLERAVWYQLKQYRHQKQSEYQYETGVIQHLTQNLGYSRKAMALSLEMLRLLRWAAKGQRLQDETGMFSYNPWLLFDCPVPVKSMIMYDHDYVGALLHQSKKVDSHYNRLTHLAREVLLQHHQVLLQDKKYQPLLLTHLQEIQNQDAERLQLINQEILQSLQKIDFDIDHSKITQDIDSVDVKHHVTFLPNSSSSIYINITTTNARARPEKQRRQKPLVVSDPLLYDNQYQQDYLVTNILNRNAHDLPINTRMEIKKIVDHRLRDSNAPKIYNLIAYVNKLIERTRDGLLDRSTIIEINQQIRTQQQQQAEISVNQQAEQARKEAQQAAAIESLKTKGAFCRDGMWHYPKANFPIKIPGCVDNGSYWVQVPKGRQSC